MMAANVVQHKTRDPAVCAGGRNPSRTTRARMRVHTRDPAHPRLCYVCIYTYVRIRTSMYLSCTYPPHIYVSAVYIYAEDQPPDPFRHRIYIGVPLFSRCRALPSFFPSFFLSASRSPRRATIHLSSSFIYDRKSRDRVGNNVLPGKKLRKEENFLELASFRSPLLLFIRPVILSSSRTSKIPPFYFACLCRRKGLGRGKLSCRIQRGDWRDIPETRRGMA